VAATCAGTERCGRLHLRGAGSLDSLGVRAQLRGAGKVVEIKK